MLNKTNTNLEHIIAKIDNDFNPDNSDWIPRVAAWCIDAMSQLNVLRTEKKKIKVPVKDRIAYSNCPINETKIKVYDDNNCEIKEANSSGCKCNGIPTGSLASETSNIKLSNTTTVVKTGNKEVPNVIANNINDKYPHRYNVVPYVLNSNSSQEHNYVLVDCNKLELNYDTDFIYIETEVIKTEHSDIYGCELPVVPNNGILIEAITNYCMYKMLTRGYNHPVFNLNASQYGTNPYYIWTQLKEEAKRSIINDEVNAGDSSKLFRSNFYIETFDSRN